MKYYGIIPPLVTPLNDHKTLDSKGVEQLVEHVISGGVHGIFLLGTTGEASGLSYQLKKDLIKLVTEVVNNRVPVLVGITSTVYTESLDLSEYAYTCNANAVVAAPQFYYFSSQDELRDYYSALADSVALPLFVYNMPNFTKIAISSQVIAELSTHKNIIGIKDSSGNAAFFQEILSVTKHRKDFSVLLGQEEAAFGAILTGADGGVHGGANVFPKLYVEMYNHASTRNFNNFSEIQEDIVGISRSLYRIGSSGVPYLKGIKCALSLLGICGSALTFPYKPFDDEDIRLVKAILEKYNHRL